MTPMPARASAAAAHALLRRTRCFATANRIRPTAKAFSGAPAGAADPQGGPENVGGMRAGDDELDIVIAGEGMVGLAVACALSNMPLTKHLRVAIIDSNPALKSKNYLKKDGIPDSRVSTITPATISFFRANMPLTKHLRVAIIDSKPALKSRNYLKKDVIPDSRVRTVTPATISFFRDIGAWEHIQQQRHAFFGKMQEMT